jgi:hypothetical protein
MKKELVIAAYQRDYGWTKYVNHDVKTTVYRKGQMSEDPREVFLEKNVGQDVHTFFLHIAKNYDNLADVTFFSQDYPFDHVYNYVDIINGDSTYWDLVCRLKIDGYWAFSTGTALNWESHMPKDAYTGNTLICDSTGAPHHRPSNLDIDTLWTQLFKCPAPKKYEFVPAGHFCATRDTIHVRSKVFYENLVSILESSRPFCPYEVERIESYVFNKSLQ